MGELALGEGPATLFLLVGSITACITSVARAGSPPSINRTAGVAIRTETGAAQGVLGIGCTAPCIPRLVSDGGPTENGRPLGDGYARLLLLLP